MFWLVLAGFAAFLIFCLAFGLGAALGVSTSQAEFFSTTLPVISAIGGWVSGFGALGAVLATLWLADRQRRDDVESLKISADAATVVPWNGTWFIALKIVSNGRRPANVRSVTVVSAHAKHAMHVTKFSRQGDQLPVTLPYGESVALHFEPAFEMELQAFVSQYCHGRKDGLKFVVSTTLCSFEAPLSRFLLELNSSQ